MKCITARLLVLCVPGFSVPTLTPQEKSKRDPQLVKPESIQGCYGLSLSEWRPKLNLGEDAEFITPPRRIQLFAEKGTKGWEAEGYIVRPAPEIPRSIHRGSYWLPKKSNYIEIDWTTGFSGLVMALKVEGDKLRGQAKSFWDFPQRTQTADVVAQKVDCEKH